MSKIKRKSNAKNRAPESTNVISLEERRTPSIRRSRKQNVEMIPRNSAQETLVTELNDEANRLVFAIGPAGTGKTLMSTLFAIKELQEGKIERIIITRPVVGADEDLGFLPGDLNEKMAPWTRPIIDVFEEYFTPYEVKNMILDGTIEIAPLAYMRGRTFKNCVIILDESQNTKPSQLKLAMTRIGDNSKMVVTGDLNQSDIGPKNGLLDIITRLENHNSDMIAVCRFGREHVERSAIVAEILDVYGEE